jgi:hypothetical protein
MPLLKVCFRLATGPLGRPRWLCVHIQGISLKGPVVPLSPDFPVDLDGKRPTWANDLEALAALQNLAREVSPTMRRVLQGTISQARREITQQLPSGVKLGP